MNEQQQSIVFARGGVETPDYPGTQNSVQVFRNGATANVVLRARDKAELVWNLLQTPRNFMVRVCTDLIWMTGTGLIKWIIASVPAGVLGTTIVYSCAFVLFFAIVTVLAYGWGPVRSKRIRSAEVLTMMILGAFT